MKKALSLLMCALYVISSMIVLSSCKKCEHEFEVTEQIDATCTTVGKTVSTCTLCGKVKEDEIPIDSNNHNYESTVTKAATYSSEGETKYTCSECGDSYTETLDKLVGNWTKEYYVDEFGDKTSSYYYMGSFKGSFSNSATSGSDLEVCVYLSSSGEDVSFRLFEYGSSRASFLSSDTITLKTKTKNGTVKEFPLTEIDGDLYVFGSTLSSLKKNLKGAYEVFTGNEQLSCVITVEHSFSSYENTYKFTTDNLGLSEIMK